MPNVCNKADNFKPGGVFTEKQLKGIALVFFGILLCCAESGLNSSIFANMSDMPMSLFGVIIGIAGLVIAFTKKGGK